MAENIESVRIDKWLWAARFFKTRRLAHDAILGGKVHVDGYKCKASKKLTLGTTLTIRQGLIQKTVEVIGLSEIRKGAPEAQLLYEETKESLQKRTKELELRKLNASTQLHNNKKPTKKQRRSILNFKKNIDGSGNE